MVPFVLLADLAEIPTPIHRGYIDIFGAILGTDFWKTGLTLDILGLADRSIREIIKYVSSKTGKFDFEGSMIEWVENSFRQFTTVQMPYFNISKTYSKKFKILETIKNILKKFR